MVVTLTDELETAVREFAQRQGVAPEVLIVNTLRDRFLPFVPRDDWERQLLSLGTDCGVSLPDSALSRDSIYE